MHTPYYIREKNDTFIHDTTTYRATNDYIAANTTPTNCNNTIYPTRVFGDPTRVFGDHPRAIFKETKVVNIIKYPKSNF